MSKIVPGKITRNMLHIFCLAIIITMALSLGSVSGADGYIYRITGTTITKAATPPEVSTNAASVITATSATLNGNLTSLGTADSVSLSFEYGETTSYGRTKAGVTPTLDSAGAFTADLTGLTSGQTYHFRAKAEGDGITYGSDQSFTTLSTAPVVTTGAASNITSTGAKVNGSLTSKGTADSVTVSFEYGETTTYGSTVAGVTPTLDSAGAFTANLNGLTSGKTYHFRAKAVGDGTVYGNDVTFTTGTPTKVTPPVVTTNAASDITATSATLNGNLSDLGSGSSVSVSFEWGTTTAYGNTLPIKALTKEGDFPKSLTGLIADTTYHFRAKAVGDGTTYGSDKSFTTSSPTPVVTTGTVSNITSIGGKLSGNLTYKGSAASVMVSFEYGKTNSYGSTVAGIPATLTDTGAFVAYMTGLTPNQTYHFRAKAVGDGTVYGKDATFTTTPLSASFTFTKFDITPPTSQIGDKVNISVTCLNNGGSPGTYRVVLKINGVSEQTEEVNLDPGKSQVVTFAITKSEAGTYDVNVNELTSAFVVQESSQLLSISTPAQSATLEESDWPLVAGIAGGTILVGLIVLFIFKRRMV